MLFTEIVSDIQNNFCTQHVLPMFCKKSFWQRSTCTADPLLIHEIKEEIKEEVFEENEATPIYIKQEEEFDASGYQIVEENGMIVQEIKEESAFWE